MLHEPGEEDKGCNPVAGDSIKILRPCQSDFIPKVLFMPLYEFGCRTCGAPFEKFVRSFSAIPTVTCPDCGSPEVEKRLSTFAVACAGWGVSGKLLISLRVLALREVSEGYRAREPAVRRRRLWKERRD